MEGPAQFRRPFLFVFEPSKDRIGTEVAQLVAGKDPLIVILSKAKNPSSFKTKDCEGFFAQNQRAE